MLKKSILNKSSAEIKILRTYLAQTNEIFMSNRWGRTAVEDSRWTRVDLRNMD